MQHYIVAIFLAVTFAEYHYDKLRDKCAWRSTLISYGKSWIEQSRPLPTGRLVSVSVRFCENREVTLQLWTQISLEKMLIWQKTVSPTEVLGTYTKISINQSAVPVIVTSSTRFGCYSPDNGVIPLFSRFLNGMQFTTISSEENGPFELNEKYEFTELPTPIYFDVIVCTENGCSNATREDHMSEVVDRCRASSLQRTGGRPLLEMQISPPSGIIRAIEMVICGVMPFFVQVWRPVKTAEQTVYQLVWQKHITCLPGRSNGRIVQIRLEPEEYFLCLPEYRVGLHVEYGDFAVPVPTRFSLYPNVAMASNPSQDALRGFTSGVTPVCRNISFDDLAIPHEFKLRLCDTEDCSLSSNTNTTESPHSYELISCNPTTTTSTTTTSMTTVTSMTTSSTQPTSMTQNTFVTSDTPVSLQTSMTISTTEVTSMTTSVTPQTSMTTTVTTPITTMKKPTTSMTILTTTKERRTTPAKKATTQPPAQAAKQNAKNSGCGLRQTRSTLLLSCLFLWLRLKL